MDAVAGRVLARIKPTREEERAAKKRNEEMVGRIQKAVPEARVVLGGSGQKGTWLRTGHDADIFVQFPKSFHDKDISSILERKIKALRPTRLHGSRDYFRIERKGFTFEIVPILKIAKADDAKNITDVSPLHSAFVKKHARLADEIRLFKQWCKAARCYGAESYINGLSGYICEVLVIHYGSFVKVAKAVAKWAPKVVIDPERKRAKRAVLFDLDKAKTQGPLVVVDPVQDSRNAAAAVSLERFDRLVAHAKAFVKKPSEDHFIEKPVDTRELKKKGALFTIIAKPPGGKDDVVGCKLLKAFGHIKRELERIGFVIAAEDWEWDEDMRFHLVLKTAALPERMRVAGPPVRLKRHAQAFRRKHRHVEEQDGRLVAYTARSFTSAEAALKHILKDTYIKERVAGIRL